MLMAMVMAVVGGGRGGDNEFFIFFLDLFFGVEKKTFSIKKE